MSSSPAAGPRAGREAAGSDPSAPMYTIPIVDRPPHGPLFSKIFFPLLFNLGIIGIHATQLAALPLLLVPIYGRRWFEAVIDWTKDGFGRLLMLITVLFAPTSLHITSDPPLPNLVERDSLGRLVRLNLPDRLVIVPNHQAYTDWMYMWILACYAGHAEGLTILLKWSLRQVPVVGWGMRFFRFIFLRRSWAADKANLTEALTRLGQHAQASSEKSPVVGALPGGAKDNQAKAETATLLPKEPKTGRSPLWLLIFPEGTITSDEERAKSVKYANKENIDDLVASLHPRSTGLLFCLRTLLPQVPDLQLLDVTIGYPGVPLGKYPQDYYGLFSVFLRSVPPPSVHIHLKLHSDLSDIPSIHAVPANQARILAENASNPESNEQIAADAGLATPEEARAFELWLRQVWKEKDERLKVFAREQKFEGGCRGEEVVRLDRLTWSDWAGAMGAGGLGVPYVALLALAKKWRQANRKSKDI